MLGTNEVKLNQATMIAALEEYFQTRMVPPPRVVSIDYSQATYSAPVVMVTIDTPEQETKHND